MRLAVALAFLISVPQDAASLQQANARDYRDIEEHIAKAIAAGDLLVIKNAALKRATGDEAVKLSDAIARLATERNHAYQQALWLTIRAYDIIPFADNEPILDEGVSVLRSPEKGRRITWIPVFNDIGPKPLQDEFGRRNGSKVFVPRNLGNTASDGVSRIFPDAFSSPAALASIIIHEKRHFAQNTTPGKSDRMTTAELEVEAYEEELRLLSQGTLGFSEEAATEQQERLTLLLDGQKGTPGFRTKAKVERAEADKARRGLPLPENSVVSHTEADIKGLVAQARDQIAIAQIDHDQRLRFAVLDLTNRTCAKPGSVTQTELDALPQAHKKDALSVSADPTERRECPRKAYAYLARGERNAQALHGLSSQPANLLQPPPMRAAPSSPRTPFSAALPGLRALSTVACETPGQVAINRRLTAPAIPYDFSKTDDDREASRLAAGLGVCEDRLFRRLIEVMRSGQGDRISAEWVRETAASYRATPGNTPGRAVPPEAVPPQSEKERDCSKGGDPFGCQPRHR